MKQNKVVIPIGISMRGHVDITVTDTVTGKVKMTSNKSNMLMYCATNIFEGYSDILVLDDSGVMIARRRYAQETSCLLGSGIVPVDRSNVPGDLEDSVSVTPNISLNVHSGMYDNPLWTTKTFIFPAGTYIGTLREVALVTRHNRGVSYSTYNDMVARQLVSPEMEVTALDQVTVTWKLIVDFGSRTWTGTISNGQLGGGDVVCTLTINNHQLRNSHSTTSHTAFNYLWVGTEAHILGTSNSASDLDNDTAMQIKGDELFNGTPPSILFSCDPYVAESDTRAVTYGFEHDDPNDCSIGELVNSHYRITFDPPLNKAEFHRLFITTRITMSTPV